MKKKINYSTKLKKLNLLILDVDGVMAESIFLGNNGLELKNYDAQDGAGIKYWRRCGHKTAIITARESESVRKRVEELGIDFLYQKALKKVDAFNDLLKQAAVTPDTVAYMGDDLPDLPVMLKVGYPIAVANARPEVKKYSDYVTKARGGHGAIREAIEQILKAQGHWKKIVDQYLKA